MMLFYLIAIRLFDIFSTYLCMSKYGGWEKIEMVPVSRYLIGTIGFVAFSLVNLLIYAAMLYVLFNMTNQEIKARLLRAVAIIQTSVVVINFLTYLWV